MAQEIPFDIQFKLAQGTLKNVRNALDKELGRPIQLDIQTSSKRSNPFTAGGSLGGGESSRLGKAQSELAQATRKAKESVEKLTAASAKRTANLSRITELEAKGASLTAEEQSELKRANASKGGLTTATNRARSNFNELAKEVDLLKSKLGAVNAGIENLGFTDLRNAFGTASSSMVEVATAAARTAGNLNRLSVPARQGQIESGESIDTDLQQTAIKQALIQKQKAIELSAELESRTASVAREIIPLLTSREATQEVLNSLTRESEELSVRANRASKAYAFRVENLIPITAELTNKMQQIDVEWGLNAAKIADVNTLQDSINARLNEVKSNQQIFVEETKAQISSARRLTEGFENIAAGLSVVQGGENEFTKITRTQELVGKAEQQRLEEINIANRFQSDLAIITRKQTAVATEQLASQEILNRLQQERRDFQAKAEEADRNIFFALRDGELVTREMIAAISDNVEGVRRTKAAIIQQARLATAQADAQERLKAATEQTTEEALGNLRAARGARRNTEDAARQASAGGVPTLGLAEEDVNADFKDQVKKGTDAVNRFRLGLFGSTESLNGLEAGSAALGVASRKFNKILEDGAVAGQLLKDDLLAQANRIRQNADSTEGLSDAQFELIQQLLNSAQSLSTLSRPIEPLRNRIEALAVGFSSATEDIVRGIIPKGSREEINKGVQEFRRIFESTGEDLRRTVQVFREQIPGAGSSAADIDSSLAIFKASTDLASKATVALANSAEQLADSRRGEASTALQKTADTELKDAKQNLTETIKRTLTSLRGAGTAAAQFVDGSPFQSLEEGLAIVRRNILAATDPGQISFLDQAGVDVSDILEQAILRAGATFESEFTKESKNVARILDTEALRGAKKLASDIGNAGRKAGELLDPKFLENAISQIATDFPRLSEQIVDDVTRPLRRQIEKAAESRSSADAEIASIRQKEKSAQEELVARINDAFRGEELREAIGGGRLAAVSRALKDVFSNASGALKNAFSKEEKQILADAEETKSANAAIISNSKRLVVALSAQVAGLRQQEANSKGTVRFEETRLRENKAVQASLARAIGLLRNQIQDSINSFDFDMALSLEKELEGLLLKRVGVEQAVADTEARLAIAFNQQLQAANKSTENLRKIETAEDDIFTAENRLANATEKAAQLQEKRNNRVSSGTDNRVGGSGPLQSFDVKSLQDFGQKLDVSTQERFVAILNQEDANLKTVNTQLKAHQGNIGKSNQLVDRLTSTMTSGQKAAFQFGFAAANAADRLLAWASPAAFIFQAIGSLREAVQVIVRLDEQVTRIAFFNPETLDRAAAGVTNLGGALRDTGQGGAQLAGSFDRLNNVTEQYIALTTAAAQTQALLLQRSRETGLEVSKLADIVLVAGRVNREAFSETGQLNPFAQAVEGLLRLEGPLGNAEKLTADLNSVLNQFQLEGSNAVLVAAQLAEVSQRSAFSAGELAEGLTRVGGAFSSVQGATVAESLEFLASASNAAQTSVSRVGTTLRQLSIGVAKSADQIKEFAGIDIIEEGQLAGPEALVKVLEVINSFQGEQAAIDFISQFTDERNASVILGLARNVDEVAESLTNLGNEETRAARTTATLRRFLAETEAQSRTVTAEFGKLRASLESLVNDSGVVDFLGSATRGLTTIVGAADSFINAIGGVAPIFAAAFAAIAPTLRNVSQGFAAGLLPSQKLAEVQGQIVSSLSQEGNLLTGVNAARAEGIISEQQVVSFRREIVNITSAISAKDREVIGLNAELAVLKKDELVNAQQINIALAKQAGLTAELEVLDAQRLAIQERAKTAVAGGAGVIRDRDFQRAKVGFGAALVGAGIFAAPLIGKSIGGETGKAVQTTLQSALSGAAIGFAIFGPAGAALAAILAVAVALRAQFVAINEQTAKEVKIRLQVAEAIKRERKLQKERDDEALDGRKKINAREQLSIQLTKDIRDLDIRIKANSEAQLGTEFLIEQKKDAQHKLNILLSQQKKLEARQLEEQVLFEERIAQIKQEQNTLTKTSELLKKAELATLNRTSSISPVIEAQINAKADERQLAIEKESIKRRLGEVNVAIFSAESQNQNAQVVKKLQKDRLALQNELANKEFDVINFRFDKAQEELNAREQVADTEAERFRNITSAANQQIKNLVDSQQKIVALIGQEADAFKEIFKLQEEGVRVAARTTAGGAVRDITDLNIRQQRDIIRRRNQILLDGAKKAGELLDRQFEQLGIVPSLEDLTIIAEELRENIKSVGGPFAEFRDSLDRSTKFKLDEIAASKQLFDIEKNLTLSEISLQKNILNQENDIARQRIALIGEELDVMQKRIDLEVKIGEELIKTPQKFLENSLKLFESEDVLQLAKVNSDNIEEGLLKIITTVNKQLGGEALKSIFEGFEVAESRGQSLVEGITPGQLTSLFARLAANPNAKLLEEQITEQQKLLNEVNSLVNVQTDNAKALLSLLAEEQAIEELLRSDADTALDQLLALNSIVESSRNGALAAESNANTARVNLQNVVTQVRALETTFSKKIPEATEGDKQIVSALVNANKLLEDIRDAREIDVGGQPQVISRAISELAGLRQGNIGKENEEAFKNALAAQNSRRNRERAPLETAFSGVSRDLSRLAAIEAELVNLEKNFSPQQLREVFSALSRGDPFALSGGVGGAGATAFGGAEGVDIPNLIKQFAAGRIGPSGFGLTAEEQKLFDTARKDSDTLAKKLRDTAKSAATLESEFKTTFIAARIATLEESLAAGGVDVIKAMGGFTNNLAGGASQVADAANAARISTALGAAELNRLAREKFNIDTGGDIKLSTATDSAVRTAAETQVAAANKSFTAACEQAAAAEKIVTSTDVAKSNNERLKTAGEALREAARQTLARAEEGRRVAAAEIAARQQERRDLLNAPVAGTPSEVDLRGDPGENARFATPRIIDPALAAEKGDRVDEGQLVENLSRTLGFDFAEAISRRISDPNQFIENFEDPFREFVNEIGLGFKTLEQIVSRTNIDSEEQVNQNLISALAGEILDKRGQDGDIPAELRSTLLEVLAPGVLAKEINSARESAAEKEKGLLEDALKNVMNDPLARQIAAMEKIIAANEGQLTQEGLFGSLTAESLAVAKQNLAELKAQFSLQQGDKERLDAIKQGLESGEEPVRLIAAGLDRLFQTTQENIDKQAQQTGQEVADATRPATDAAVKNVSETAKLNAKIDSLINEINTLKQQQTTQHDQNAIQRKQLSDAEKAKVVIDEASREDFISSFKEKFDEACQLWVTQFRNAINDGSLDVTVGPIEMEIEAIIENIIRGEDFAQQLATALLGTGLESQVDVIQEAVAELVQVEIDRSGRAGNAGINVMDSSGSRNKTRKPKVRVRGSNLT